MLFRSACMNGSECIVAVNSDPEAPIFRLASICVQDDLHEVLPAMIEEMKSRKGGE